MRRWMSSFELAVPYKTPAEVRERLEAYKRSWGSSGLRIRLRGEEIRVYRPNTVANGSQPVFFCRVEPATEGALLSGTLSWSGQWFYRFIVLGVSAVFLLLALGATFHGDFARAVSPFGIAAVFFLGLGLWDMHTEPKDRARETERLRSGLAQALSTIVQHVDQS